MSQDLEFVPILRARISWLSEADGGRRSPPAGPLYFTNALLHESNSDDDALYLSIVIRPLPGESFRAAQTVAEMTTLVHKTRGRLKSTHTFDVMEGPRKVGEGTVEQVFDSPNSA